MNIVIYSKAACPNCVAAKKLLESKGIPFHTVGLNNDADMAEFVRAHPDARQMPQIFIDGQRVGGLAGLQAALKQLEANT